MNDQPLRDKLRYLDSRIKDADAQAAELSETLYELNMKRNNVVRDILFNEELLKAIPWILILRRDGYVELVPNSSLNADASKEIEDLDILVRTGYQQDCLPFIKSCELMVDKLPVVHDRRLRSQGRRSCGRQGARCMVQAAVSRCAAQPGRRREGAAEGREFPAEEVVIEERQALLVTRDLIEVLKQHVREGMTPNDVVQITFAWACGIMICETGCSPAELGYEAEKYGRRALDAPAPGGIA
jgi:hypothetical protein